MGKYVSCLVFRCLVANMPVLELPEVLELLVLLRIFLIFVFCEHFIHEYIRICVWSRILYSCYTGQPQLVLCKKYACSKSLHLALHV